MNQEISVLNFESASFGQLAFSSGRFTENVLAVVAGDHCLCVAEDDGSLVASSALDVHEVGVRRRHQSL